MAKDKEKVAYIMNLLGRKRGVEVNISHDNDSDREINKLDSEDDFEDIYSSHLKSSMIHKIANPEFSFNPQDSPIKDDYISKTVDDQEDTEMLILECYKEHPQLQFSDKLHLAYVRKSLQSQLPHYYNSLDANHPWMMYWLANPQSLISEEPLTAQIVDLINDKISRCIRSEGLGGIAGGANQMGHAASTYAGVLSLILTENYELLDKIRHNLYKWFISLKLPNGSFAMHVGGESDTRSTYCVLSVAAILNIVTDELVEKTAEWLLSCQTYEGGFAGVPYTEAHGGYSFCALASFFILYNKKSQFQEKSSVHLDALIKWAVSRQYGVEGGLSGRTNKLVDACYSFWIGALYPMLESVTGEGELFSREALGHYILRCAQAEGGGFRDKPGKSVDFYHTNYTLCGLSLCETLFTIDDDDEKEDSIPLAFKFMYKTIDSNSFTGPINPVYGLPFDLTNTCRDHFYRLDNEA
ncbi:hypothetical protein G9P44_003338 [Scheffersomyces stipitis]|nr:hypothetical protein G9P44_003338 [Scheffersomyces stipitis]